MTTTNSWLKAIAISKSKTLENGRTIRLTSDKESYWIFNMKGKIYIGSLLKDCEMPKFYAHKPALEIRSNNVVVARVQELN